MRFAQLADSLAFFAVFIGARELFFRGVAQLAFGLIPSALIYALVLPAAISGTFSEYVFLFAYFLISGFALGMLSEKFGALAAVVCAEIYLLLVLVTSSSPYFASVVALLFMLLTPFVWYAHKKKKMREALAELGLVRKNLLFNFFVGIGCIATVLACLLLWSIVSASAGIYDQGKVQEKIQTAPIYVALLAITLSPFGEELFFRGFLVPRAGIVISSILFAGAHHMYGSVFELGGAFIAGIIFAYAFKRTGSLAGPITAHLILNLISISVMKGVV
ncbi:MAG: type II CAAX endopeptidase family protein [Candidatus Micrarchaeota archaeon]